MNDLLTARQRALDAITAPASIEAANQLGRTLCANYGVRLPLATLDELVAVCDDIAGNDEWLLAVQVDAMHRAMRQAR